MTMRITLRKKEPTDAVYFFGNMRWFGGRNVSVAQDPVDPSRLIISIRNLVVDCHPGRDYEEQPDDANHPPIPAVVPAT